MALPWGRNHHCSPHSPWGGWDAHRGWEASVTVTHVQMLRSHVLVHPRAAGALCPPVSHSPGGWLQPHTCVCAQGEHLLC